jgi:8-oxo-dGTP pyrophosphatase MutT (NUDIX family)
MTIIKAIRDSLNNRKLMTIDNSGSIYVHASVLIPILNEDGQYRVLFTKRTDRVEHHKGQISFPGGAVDKEDGSLEETAFREAYEEIGLLKKDVELLGRIDYPGIRFHYTPLCGTNTVSLSLQNKSP